MKQGSLSMPSFIARFPSLFTYSWIAPIPIFLSSPHRPLPHLDVEHGAMEVKQGVRRLARLPPRSRAPPWRGTMELHPVPAFPSSYGGSFTAERPARWSGGARPRSGGTRPWWSGLARGGGTRPSPPSPSDETRSLLSGSFVPVSCCGKRR